MSIFVCQELEGEAEGYIAFKQPWPGIMRTVYGDHERFEKTYFARLVFPYIFLISVILIMFVIISLSLKVLEGLY